MDKKKLVELVRVKTGWDWEMAKRSVDMVFDGVRSLVDNGGRLTIHGFGSFISRMAKPRRARNLKTGAAILVPARRQVKFKPSPEFFK